MTPGTRRQLRPTDVKRLNRTWRRNTENRLSLILESVTGPFNVGSIFRTAAAFGADQIWLAGNATPPTNPKVGKTALGTDRLVNWHEAVPALDAVRAAKEDGYHVIAVELTSDAVPLHEARLSRDICLILGSEDHGCSPAVLEAADETLYIPQVGRVGSFNVATAAAITLAEVRRQEWSSTPSPSAANESP
ncbi:tRNA/rRNA methyltransferase [Sphaerisporangium krabiense]|uniref:tRNA (Guanosine-2'-O-)-methyltransferase n=1 Tax=Sphaerisporangium krabiense TaxID=763782 RepID=A0A7W8ZC07_9ACTN|nr:RNA methyltransferase [Sphaerisporangium krabiense]MBB5631202.1 tRNA (guanosine-2'-O-)-methyltransferase [Sphaerisporangium krabiense]GII61185.1 tRNA/rRNA methyltransferase [Sphaerisporangium krabiense]